MRKFLKVLRNILLGLLAILLIILVGVFIYNQVMLLKICKLKPAFILLYLDFIIPIIGYIV